MSSWSESKKPTPDYSDDDFRVLLRATLLEARFKLDKAIAALDKDDGYAYASAVREFQTVRQTAAEWLREMS